MQLSGVKLRVKSPQNLARFYVEKLGMAVRETEGDQDAVVVGYNGDDACLHLCRAASTTEAYKQKTTDCYWKIGITLPNVDFAHKKLAQDADVTGLCGGQPSQFGDIGYMCHIEDPEGFTIEFLQHKFEGNRGDNEGDEDAPFSEARIGQITLRASDMHTCLAFYRDKLGMKLLSVQPVVKHGFTLYFLAFTADRPPNEEDLEAVENREWLWQRPYTTLELQHFDTTRSFDLPREGEMGFAGIRISGAGGGAEGGEKLLGRRGAIVELCP